MKFQDRQEAAEKLADKLEKHSLPSPVVYVLPRGGVPLGMVIANRLEAPLDLIIARKVGHPFNPEYAVCAVTEEGEPVCNELEIRSIDQQWLEQAINKERQEAKRRRQVYLADQQAISVRGKTAILVDDGVATGLTMRAAIAELRQHKPVRLVVAVPVVPADTAETLQDEADLLVTLINTEDYLGSVGAYYEDFHQIEDEEVINMLVDFEY